MRLVFLLLILANLVFFAWAQGFWGIQEEGREPQRLALQIAPQSLHVDVIDSSPAATPATAEACRLVRGLALDEAQRLLSQAREKMPELKIVVNANETRAILYWVYIPAQPSKLVVDKKSAELTKLGVTNFSIMSDEGRDKFAISLGLFDTQQGANEYMQELSKRGVRSARVQIRENLLDNAHMEVRGPGGSLAKQLAVLLGGQANARVSDCPSRP